MSSHAPSHTATSAIRRPQVRSRLRRTLVRTRARIWSSVSISTSGEDFATSSNTLSDTGGSLASGCLDLIAQRFPDFLVDVPEFVGEPDLLDIARTFQRDREV